MGNEKVSVGRQSSLVTTAEDQGHSRIAFGGFIAIADRWLRRNLLLVPGGWAFSITDIDCVLT
jgi:hypothetical protein